MHAASARTRRSPASHPLRHLSGHPDTLGVVAVGSASIELRRARRGDVAAIVGLLADDPIGRRREAVPDRGEPGVVGDALSPYLRAFDLVDADPAHLLVVAVDDGEVVGTLQLSFVPGLARRGALRAQIEAVSVQASHRGRGLGSAMVGWAVEQARRRGCGLVQLTSDKRRHDAHRFYERLGFVATHEGMKLEL